jgi:hypothetical protein
MMTALTIMKPSVHISNYLSLNMNLVLVTCMIWIIRISDAACRRDRTEAERAKQKYENQVPTNFPEMKQSCTNSGCQKGGMKQFPQGSHNSGVTHELYCYLAVSATCVTHYILLYMQEKMQ